MMKQGLRSILDEILFIIGDSDSELTDLILDFGKMVADRQCCCRALMTALRIREKLLQRKNYHVRELMQWVENNIVATTFCPDCGYKRDILPIEITSSDLRSILEECHRYYCYCVRQNYPGEEKVFYAFSYKDEIHCPVITEDLHWYDVSNQN